MAVVMHVCYGFDLPNLMRGEMGDRLGAVTPKGVKSRVSMPVWPFVG
jgi:hypothetical protein